MWDLIHYYWGPYKRGNMETEICAQECQHENEDTRSISQGFQRIQTIHRR